MTTTLINTTRRIINALRTPRSTTRPSTGQLLTTRPEDTWRDYPSSNLTPSRLFAILREADAGHPAAAMQLYEEMEEKDPHLYAVANTRRLALTGLDWTITPDPRAENRDLAMATANHARNILSRTSGFDDTLQHLALATGRNIAIAELVWTQKGDRLVLSETVPVDFTRIVFDDTDQPRILTDDARFDGIDLAPNKFILHTPHCTTGHATRGGLLRVTAMAYLAKNLALKDWMIFAETFGMPVRIARYEPSATPEEKREMLHMLESLGANAAGIFSRAVDLQIVEANRGNAGPPYERLLDFLNREISKAWLGQTLTTDTTGAKGSLSATTVHEQVRQDILTDDIRKEANTIKRDILTPLILFRFGPDAPVPNFTRKVNRARTAQPLADLIATAVNELGAQIPADWAHDQLGLPRATTTQDTLTGNASR